MMQLPTPTDMKTTPSQCTNPNELYRFRLDFKPVTFFVDMKNCIY